MKKRTSHEQAESVLELYDYQNDPRELKNLAPTSTLRADFQARFERIAAARAAGNGGHILLDIR